MRGRKLATTQIPTEKSSSVQNISISLRKFTEERSVLRNTLGETGKSKQ